MLSFMVRELNEKEIRKFIDFGDELYCSDSNYVPYMRMDIRKTIKTLVFKKKTYRAVCSFDENGKMNGRMLVTVKPNKQLNTEKCGYFSYFEIVNNQNVFNELFDKAVFIVKEMGAEYIAGSFFPHDPDNRRGILVKGFDLPPMIFTSHNPPYYGGLFEGYGFEKLTDALEYQYVEKPEVVERIRSTAEKALVENDIHISTLNLSDIDNEIDDIHKIMEIASTKINFEKVISKEKIKNIFKMWKPFINPDYALIARKNSDNSPVGFTFSIPDYFELIRMMKGRINLKSLWIFLTKRKKMSGLRAILQYIIPEYQHKGVSKALYYETKKAVDKNNVKRISLGTIMEANINSNGAIVSLGGELSRVYRIYYKKI